MMKKHFYYVMALLCLIGISVSCKKDKGPDGGSEKPLSFTTETTEISHDKVSFSIVPSENDRAYVYFLKNASEIESVAGDEKKEQEMLYAYLDGIAAEGDLSDIMVKGEVKGSFDGLKPVTEYALCIVGTAPDGKATTPFHVLKFKTLEKEALTFSTEITEVTSETVSFRITPSNNEDTYLTFVMTSSEADKIIGNGDGSELIASYMEKVEALVSAAGIEFSEVLLKGVCEDKVDDLAEDTDYYLLTFGISADKTVTTALVKEKFRTKVFEITDDCTFDISVENIKADVADIVIVPSDNNTRYYVNVLTKEKMSQMTPEEIADYFIELENTEFNIDWATSPFIYTGKQTLNTYDDLKLEKFEPATEYVVVVFGVNASGIRTTEVALSDVFTTVDDSANELVIECLVHDIEGRGAVVEYIPTNNTATYVCSVVNKSELEGLTDEEYIQKYIEDWKDYIDDMLVSGHEVYDYRIMNTLYFDTEYVSFAFGYENGQVTTGLFKVEFRTLPYEG